MVFLKRAVALILFICLVFSLSSCNGEQEIAKQFVIPMRFCASTSGDDSKYFVDITSEKSIFSFDEANALHGAEICFMQEECIFSVGEYSYTVAKERFPAMKTLDFAVRTLAKGETEGVKTENGVKYTIDETVILVYYNKDTEIVTGIRTEELGRVFEFTLSDLEPYEAQSNGAGQP